MLGIHDEARIIPRVKLKFSKMQGAGNDFVVLDATRAPLTLDASQLRRLGDRRYGVGADQILVVDSSHEPGVDFHYRIYNGADGGEVEQCGNGARCFVRYVVDHGLSSKRTLTIRTTATTLELRLEDDGRVTVDMNEPIFDSARIPFDASGLMPREVGGFPLWPVEVDDRRIELAVLSMGNPHAVQWIDGDIDAAPVATVGPLIERHARFPRRVNAGFAQRIDRSHIRLRVWERGAGETLACGTGACAAVVSGIRLGLLDSRVEVEARGGRLTIFWPGPAHPVLMTGPAEQVYEGEIDV